MIEYPLTPKVAETVLVNGQHIYYKVYGKGDPLFLLHGFTQSSKSWRPFLPDYEKEFEVYLVDLRRHGKSSWFKEKISVRAVAEDLGALAKHLKLDGINAVGFRGRGKI